MSNVTKIRAASAFSGFKNSPTKLFSVSVPGQNLGAGAFVHYTASTTLDNANAISQVQVKYTNLETFWRVVPGMTIGRYPTYAVPNYEIGSLVYFTGGSVTVYTYIANQTGGVVAIPAISIDCSASLFLAPF
jgi:hypothetical protein